MKEPLINKMVTREQLIEQMADAGTTWDVLVIGGGASGLGIAVDAATRGYKTLLVEQADFAKGTSSRSTKLIHGGVRYLAQGNIRLVREASIERGLLCRNAPHLVKNQIFIIPVYNKWDRLKYTIGLKVYDWISGKFSLGPSIFISRSKTKESLPGVRTNGLLGGVVYHDGQFDDSRPAINLAQTIISKGGFAINYVKVTSLLKNSAGKLAGAVVEDIETAICYTIKAKAIVNATGVFVDDILRMDNVGASKTVCVSQGVHVVLDKKFFPSTQALMIPETSDGRVLFAVPWYDKVVVGTTDTPVDRAALEPQALENEIDFILQTAGVYLTSKPCRPDVLSVFAGLRPLAVPTHSKKTKEISRSHKILVSDSNLFTILGGKWTTYRKMGEDMIDRIERHLNWKHRPCQTAAVAIHGASSGVASADSFSFYGSDAVFLKQRMTGMENNWISKSLKIHQVQVYWAVEQEMARTVEDVLSRRTRALLLDAKESVRICPEVARIMAEVLKKGDQWIQKEIVNYTHLAQQYILRESTAK